MAQHRPCFPVLAFVFLVVHVHVPAFHAGALPPTYDGSMCSESSRCGSVEIRYPFYLATGTRVIAADNSTYSCGYTDLRISCQGFGEAETAIIQLDQHNYTVKDVFYDTSTILLADPDAFLGRGDNGCPIMLHNVSFSEEWLDYTGARDNLTFFSSCYLGEGMPPALDEYRIGCPEFRNLLGARAFFVFSNDEHDAPGYHYLAEHCDHILSVPVLSDSVDRMSNWSMLRSSYGDVLRNGFELVWIKSTAGDCYRCEDSGGHCAYSQNKTVLGCLCPDEKVETQYCSTPSPRSRHKKRTKIYIIASTTCLLLLCLITLTLYLTYKYSSLLSKTKDAPSIESFLQKNGNIHSKRYTYAEVKRMTKSFAVKLGQGGFGTVYRGNLRDGCEVAVKMLKSRKGDGEEFMNEVSSISRTSHVNVVTLLGFCLQGPKRALIYEYMPNGSLEKYAFNKNFSNESTFTWDKLFEIAIGIARGLEYLHRGCNTRIVHFDIKPHNILLDHDFCPKISDFGLAKLCLNKESAISITGARGTIGYIAPEVYSKQFGTVSSKSDVYSYGMMVLEMVGARDKTNTSANSESSSQYFPQWVYEHLDDYCISACENNGETTELAR